MSLKIDQALVQSFIDGSFSLPIAHENVDYTPTAGTAYAQLMVFPNPVDMRSLNDRNETTGVLQVTLRYPVNGGAIAAKTKAEAIASYYSLGSSVTYSSQSVKIMSVSRQPGIVEDGWYKVILNINYFALIAR